MNTRAAQPATAAVLTVFLLDPTAPRYGFELSQMIGRSQPAAVYAILRRLTASGYLTAEREDVDPAAVGRPPRIYYRITAAGVAYAHQVVTWRPTRITRP